MNISQSSGTAAMENIHGPPEDFSQNWMWEHIWFFLAAIDWWKLIIGLAVVSNLKHIPLVYHLRILNAVRFVLRSQRPAVDIQPQQLFQPLITSSRSSLLDIDVYGHKVSAFSSNGDHALIKLEQFYLFHRC
jgi:hypothetical protein